MILSSRFSGIRESSHRRTYLDKDRTCSERVEHGKLVAELKAKILSDPSQYRISEDRIISVKRPSFLKTCILIFIELLPIVIIL